MHSVLSNYLLNEGKPPLDYILEKFEDHDIVLLGEMHYIRQQVELYHRLIPLLPDHGITIVATEFGRRADQALIDELLSKEWFDVPGKADCPQAGSLLGIPGVSGYIQVDLAAKPHKPTHKANPLRWLERSIQLEAIQPDMPRTKPQTQSRGDQADLEGLQRKDLAGSVKCISSSRS